MGEGDEALLVAHKLRHAGYAVEMGYSGNLKKRLARANKANARAAVILGEDELSRRAATVPLGISSPPVPRNRVIIRSTNELFAAR